MTGPDALGGLGTGVLAQLACLAGALSYGFAGIFGRRFKRIGIAPIVTAAGQMNASSVLLLAVMLLVDRPWTLAAPHSTTWGAVLGVGLLSTAIAYVLYFQILATAGATNLLLVAFLIPVSAVLPGTLVLGEDLLPRHLTGMALIGTGLACIDGRLLRLIARCRPGWYCAMRHSSNGARERVSNGTLAAGENARCRACWVRSSRTVSAGRGHVP
jgi:drug/metabolite transporter (DMT)-like permease